VSSVTSTPAPRSAAIVAAVCVAEVLGLAGYSTVPALLPQFIEAWSLTNTQAGWLAGIVSAGYMLAVVPLVSLTDRQPARLIYLASSALSALSCFGIALCDSLLPALGFRAVVGIALAGMYMPGLQALTAGIDGTMRSRIAAWYTSSFTIGASLSFLLGRTGTLWGWRGAFVFAGILSTVGVVIDNLRLLLGCRCRAEKRAQDGLLALLILGRNRRGSYGAVLSTAMDDARPTSSRLRWEPPFIIVN
jgi:MFS family permease